MDTASYTFGDIGRGLGWLALVLSLLAAPVGLLVMDEVEPLTPCERAEAMRGWEAEDCDARGDNEVRSSAYVWAYGRPTRRPKTPKAPR